MSGVLSKYLSYIIGKQAGGMSDREAKAWAEVDGLRQDLARERAKVEWLCRQMAFRDTGEPCPHYHRSAEAWEALADLFSKGGGDECRKS